MEGERLRVAIDPARVGDRGSISVAPRDELGRDGNCGVPLSVLLLLGPTGMSRPHGNVNGSIGMGELQSLPCDKAALSSSSSTPSCVNSLP